VGNGNLPAAACILLALTRRVVRHQPAGDAGGWLRAADTGASGGQLFTLELNTGAWHIGRRAVRTQGVQEHCAPRAWRKAGGARQLADC